MSLGKWSFRGRNRSTTSSGKSDMSATSSSSTTRASSPANNRSSNNGGNSNRNSKASSASSSSSSRLSWFRSSNRPKRKSIISRDDPAFARLHKPFTPQNLEHQKLLSTFEWTFDDESDRKRRRTSLSISPCASRNATIDDYAPDCCGYGYGGSGQDGQHSHDHALPPNGRQNTLSGPFAGLSMRDGPGEDFDPENTS
ncbi:hypothetical protein F4859DRAFT_512708 [Xylaria cf. heliscus]|nr:hypothetical protein F4859DRAFT_512708 [Xylaria cf. heliscus]